MSSFLDFIKQENEESQNLLLNKYIDVEEINEIEEIEEIELINPIKLENNTKSKFSFSKNDKEIKQMNNPNHNTFNEFFFKKGNFVKVVRTPRKYEIDSLGNIHILERGARLCDIYCGYIGEIKQFFKGNDSAMVVLHALNNMKPMSFPVECLVKID